MKFKLPDFFIGENQEFDFTPQFLVKLTEANFFREFELILPGTEAKHDFVSS